MIISDVYYNKLLLNRNVMTKYYLVKFFMLSALLTKNVPDMKNIEV